MDDIETLKFLDDLFVKIEDKDKTRLYVYEEYYPRIGWRWTISYSIKPFSRKYESKFIYILIKFTDGWSICGWQLENPKRRNWISYNAKDNGDLKIFKSGIKTLH